MKTLVHREAVSSEPPFDFTKLKGFLRVDHDEEDLLIYDLGHAAAAEIEHFAQIALVNQIIRVVILNPAQQCGFALPVGPAAADATAIVTVDGDVFTGFQFEGGKRPYLRWLSPFYELSPSRVVIEYQAGFGPTNTAIPADLAQAIRDQAAIYYDARGPVDAKTLSSSPHMARIGARYRGVSV